MMPWRGAAPVRMTRIRRQPRRLYRNDDAVRAMTVVTRAVAGGAVTSASPLNPWHDHSP
jgi:hypothetical protein